MINKYVIIHGFKKFTAANGLLGQVIRREGDNLRWGIDLVEDGYVGMQARWVKRKDFELYTGYLEIASRDRLKLFHVSNGVIAISRDNEQRASAYSDGRGKDQRSRSPLRRRSRSIPENDGWQ